MQNKIYTAEKVFTNLNIEAFNEMQLAAFEAYNQPKDLILLSPTGTGKTLGFLWPMLQQLDAQSEKVQTLIIAPSRELALQIETVFRAMKTGYKCNCVYGGHPMRIEKSELSHAPAVLVGTPGRILDHIDRGHFDPSEVNTLILDEFDKTLELGFQDTMEKIVKLLPKVKKRVLTSATKAIEVPEFLPLKKAQEVNFLKDKGRNKLLKIKTLEIDERDKLKDLVKLICHLGNETTLVFCNHRDAVERVSEGLEAKGIIHSYFHGGLEQLDREKTLIKFRNGSFNLLVTTDLAARGLDIPEIKYVVHYHMPTTLETFTHRNGRTARMNERGIAFIIKSVDEQQKEYLPGTPSYFSLPEDLKLPPKPEYTTLHIGKGKKDKVNKGDVLGFLTKQGGLDGKDIGKIDVKDFFCLVAVNRKKIHDVSRALQGKKIKNKKVKVAVSISVR